MKTSISLHFDGPIAADHKVQLRTFSKTLGHIQTAIDRAFLDIKYGNVWKNARLKDDEYSEAEFLMTQTRNGGFIADLVGDKSTTGLVKRIHDAVMPAYEQAQQPVVEEQAKLIDLVKMRRAHFKAGAQKPQLYDSLVVANDKHIARAFGDRSIVKEFDQIASAIRARENDGSLVEFSFDAGGALPTLVFDANIAANFHNVVSKRSLGDPVLLRTTLRGLDSMSGGVAKAKAMNIWSKKEFALHVDTDGLFKKLKKYLTKNNRPEFMIVCCPILEYGAFDPLAGDMYLIEIVDDSYLEDTDNSIVKGAGK